MTKLGEYLGSLVGEISKARALADIESTEIAKMYAKDPLLKNFPIPKFRVDSIELTVPIGVQGFSKRPVKNLQPINNIEFNSNAYSSLKDTSEVNSFNRSTASLFAKHIALHTSELEKAIKANGFSDSKLETYAQTIGKSFFSICKKGGYDSKAILSRLSIDEVGFRKRLEQNLKEKLEPLIKKDSSETEGVEIVAEEHKLRELNPENLVKIKMVLNEEGVQWEEMEGADGKIIRKLLPE